MNPFRAVWNFWTVPIRAEPLALFRILLALTIIGSQLTGFGPKLVRMCGEDSLIPPSAGDEWMASKNKICVMRGPVGMPFLSDWLPEPLAGRYPFLNKWMPDKTAKAWADWGAKPSSVYLLFGIYLASLVTLTVGFWTRTSTLVALILANSFNHRLSWLTNGGDDLFCNGLYFLLLSPAGAVWSLDHWLRRRRQLRLGLPMDDSPVMIAPWSVRLMQIQVCMIYLFTGLVKTGDDPFVLELFGEKGDVDEPSERYPYRGDYISGAALYWVLNDVTLTRWPYCMLPIPYFICRMMTWTTLTFEVGFTFFAMIRPLRPWLLLIGLGMHIGILVLMEIGWFSQVMVCWYVLFLSGESVSGFFQGLGRRLGVGQAFQPDRGLGSVSKA